MLSLTDCFSRYSAGVAFKQIRCSRRVKAVNRDGERHFLRFGVRRVGVQKGVKFRPRRRAADAVNRQAVLFLKCLQCRKCFVAEVAVSAVFR